jgi:SEC-C motif-containing protein
MAKKSRQAAMTDCPCGSGQTFEQCCQRFLSGAQLPETAEQLMRSRYSAYVLKDKSYLLKTWQADHRPASLELDQSSNQWIGLKIKHTHLGQANDQEGYVHFIVHYKINGKAYKMEENSYFVKLHEQWLYVKAQD